MGGGLITVRVRSRTISNWAEQQQYGIIVLWNKAGKAWHLRRHPIKLPLLASEIIGVIEIGRFSRGRHQGGRRGRKGYTPLCAGSEGLKENGNARYGSQVRCNGAMAGASGALPGLLAQWLNAVRPSACLSSPPLLTKHYSCHVWPPTGQNHANPKKKSPILLPE
jgi:hypothetical protein